MLRSLKCEVQKSGRFSKLGVVWAIFFIVSILVTVIEYYSMLDFNQNNIFMEYFIANLDFILVKIMLPAMLILVSATTFATEFSSGTMKTFLVCGIKRSKIFLGKIVFLFFTMLLYVFFIVISLTIIFLFLKGGEFVLSVNYLKVISLYFLAGFGTFPVMLLVVLFSLFIMNFEKCLIASFASFFIFLSADSIIEKPFCTPTGFLNGCSLLFNNSIGDYYYGVAFWMLYCIALIVISFCIFNRKDIWS